MCCRGLHRVANPPYLKGFPFCGLRRVAPYCAPDGISITLIFAGHRHLRQTGRFDLWKKVGLCGRSPDPSIKLWSFRTRRPPRSLRLPRHVSVQASFITQAELRLRTSGWRFERYASCQVCKSPVPLHSSVLVSSPPVAAVRPAAPPFYPASPRIRR